MNTNGVARKWTAEPSDIALGGAVKSPHPPFGKGGQRVARGDFRAQLCPKLVRFNLGFVTILVMACCLVLGAFASPAAAETIIVTTLTDTADPPFNADDPCGTGTISDLPGADGLISLREAISAANNTNGEQTVTFDPSLSGGIIVVNFDDLDGDTTPDPLPALCGGHTHIDGDLDGDDVPDIALEGSAFPGPSGVAGISVISSHNTVRGLQVQHFPVGFLVQAGDATTPGTVTHTRVQNNILSGSAQNGILVVTGDAPGSVLADTTLTHNLVMTNTGVGIRVLANQSAAGSDTHLAHTTITDNEVIGNSNLGITMASRGDNNVITAATLARNTVSGNTSVGINVMGGFAGADGNTLDVRIQDNTVADNGNVGIRVVAAQDNSSHNHVVARVRGNTVERNQVIGIATLAALGAGVFPTGTSVNNVLEVRIEQNTVKSQAGVGITVFGGTGNPDGRAGAVADNNQVQAVVVQNTVEDNTGRGIGLGAGGSGLASANTVEVWVARNTVCHNGADIAGEGGTGTVFVPVPNQGTGNLLEGRITHNTATTITVEDGVPGNQADVTQFNNDPCP